jgi:hypothetical protein
MTVQVGIVNLLTRGGLAVKGKQHGIYLYCRNLARFYYY